MVCDSVMRVEALLLSQRLRVVLALVLISVAISISWGSSADARAAGNPGCPEWESLAAEVGWLPEDLPVLSRIMWAESRCMPDAVSLSNDFGLLQVNKAVWQSEIKQLGYEMSDLLEPRAGLIAGLHVAYRFEEHGRCKWEAWYRSGSWCDERNQTRPFGRSRELLAYSGMTYFLPLLIAGLGLTPWILKRVRQKRPYLPDRQNF